MSEKERLYIAMPRDGKEMVNRCVAAGCSNAPSDRVSLLYFKAHMGKASTADCSSVEIYQALSFLCGDDFTEDLFRGGWAAMTVWDRGKGGCIPSTCCKVAAGGW